jgi:prophage antirepressor-like protein
MLTPPSGGAFSLTSFLFEGHEIRIVNRDGTLWDHESGGKPWWALVDVCKAVGIGNAPMVASRLRPDEKDAISITDSAGRPNRRTIVNHKDAVSRLDADERDYIGLADTMGRERETLIISEPGLYNLSRTSTKTWRQAVLAVGHARSPADAPVHGCSKPDDFRQCTNAGYLALWGMTAKELRTKHNLSGGADFFLAVLLNMGLRCLFSMAFG